MCIIKLERTDDQNQPFCFSDVRSEVLHSMDHRAREVAVKNRSDVHQVEYKADDEQAGYWVF